MALGFVLRFFRLGMCRFVAQCGFLLRGGRLNRQGAKDAKGEGAAVVLGALGVLAVSLVFGPRIVPPINGSCCAVDARRAQQNLGSEAGPGVMSEYFLRLS